MGFFHKGSGGRGIAPGDVCLTPAPANPVPYVNTLSASDLANGSRTVKIEGQPTALEDQSFVAVSTGDEGGTAGGNVVTHRIKGKGYFKVWSFIVQVEGKGVCRHGDMMGQNCASTPPGCVDMKALVNFLLAEGVDIGKPCPPYRRLTKQTPAQYEKVKGGPCWECQRDWPAKDYGGMSPYVSGRKTKEQFTPDHQPPMNIAWAMGGCHLGEDKFKEWARRPCTVKPHCAAHSSSQGGTVGHLKTFDAIVSFLGI